MICRKCKNEIPDGSLYCNYCGIIQTAVRSPFKRGNGTGSVYKRNGKWQAEVCRYAGGKRLRKYKGGFRTKKEALEALPGLMDENSLQRRQSISFNGLWDKLQETERFRKLSDGKQEQWKYAFNKCKELQRAADFREIRFEHMQRAVRGLTYYPARDVKILLNAMATLAMKYEWADRNFAELIELPPQPQPDKQIFSDDQIEQLWSAAEDPDVQWILLSIYTGLRPIELRKLRVENIHPDARYMMGGQKTEHSRKSPIALPLRIIPVLEKLMAAATGPELVPFTGDDDFYDRFYSALDRAGIENPDRKLTPVCCRHTFVTMLTRAGTQAAIVQKAARHTKYQTTLGYTHIDVADVLEAMDAAPGLVGNAVGNKK